MVDHKFMKAGVIVGVVGTAVLIAGVVIMTYPELEMDRHGDREVAHPYLLVGIVMSLMGLIVLPIGFSLYVIGKRSGTAGVATQAGSSGRRSYR
ncbi:MAG: hypothetical protein JSV90_06695 [Methanobacteriota archaeon]|nr:MAG: hypothetical protein JSV90_06695 [Euryarchaeota archaeon]